MANAVKLRTPAVCTHPALAVREEYRAWHRIGIPGPAPEEGITRTGRIGVVCPACGWNRYYANLVQAPVFVQRLWNAFIAVAAEGQED